MRMGSMGFPYAVPTRTDQNSKPWGSKAPGRQDVPVPRAQRLSKVAVISKRLR